MVNLPEPELLRCSFCNKDRNDVRKLIAGTPPPVDPCLPAQQASPTVFICDECVEVCNRIIADDNRFDQRGTRSPSGLYGPPIPCALCGMSVSRADVLSIRERGVVCLGCAAAVEAAIAERRSEK